MPCNIGYKSYAKIEIPEPQPQTFKAKSDAPSIDADLLAKLGSEDPEFLEWVGELNVRPLLEEALKRALSNVRTRGVEFSLADDGTLEAKGRYSNDREKKNLSDASSSVSKRWQFEVLGIATQLLGYTFTIRQNGDELILEAEEEGKSHPCDYIKISKKSGNSTLVFEHFKSRKELQVETAKFLVLADKLGIKIILDDTSVSEGDPFPSEHRHTHGHRHTNNGHDHDD